MAILRFNSTTRQIEFSGEKHKKYARWSPYNATEEGRRLREAVNTKPAFEKIGKKYYPTGNPNYWKDTGRTYDIRDHDVTRDYEPRRVADPREHIDSRTGQPGKADSAYRQSEVRPPGKEPGSIKPDPTPGKIHVTRPQRVQGIPENAPASAFNLKIWSNARGKKSRRDAYDTAVAANSVAEEMKVGKQDIANARKKIKSTVGKATGKLKETPAEANATVKAIQARRAKIAEDTLQKKLQGAHRSKKESIGILEGESDRGVERVRKAMASETRVARRIIHAYTHHKGYTYKNKAGRIVPDYQKGYRTIQPSDMEEYHKRLQAAVKPEQHRAVLKGGRFESGIIRRLARGIPGEGEIGREAAKEQATRMYKTMLNTARTGGATEGYKKWLGQDLRAGNSQEPLIRGTPKPFGTGTFTHAERMARAQSVTVERAEDSIGAAAAREAAEKSGSGIPHIETPEERLNKKWNNIAEKVMERAKKYDKESTLGREQNKRLQENALKNPRIFKDIKSHLPKPPRPEPKGYPTFKKLGLGILGVGAAVGAGIYGKKKYDEWKENQLASRMAIVEFAAIEFDARKKATEKVIKVIKTGKSIASGLEAEAFDPKKYAIMWANVTNMPRTGKWGRTAHQKRLEEEFAAYQNRYGKDVAAYHAERDPSQKPVQMNKVIENMNRRPDAAASTNVVHTNDDVAREAIQNAVEPTLPTFGTPLKDVLEHVATERLGANLRREGAEAYAKGVGMNTSASEGGLRKMFDEERVLRTKAEKAADALRDQLEQKGIPIAEAHAAGHKAGKIEGHAAGLEEGVTAGVKSADQYWAPRNKVYQQMITKAKSRGKRDVTEANRTKVRNTLIGTGLGAAAGVGGTAYIVKRNQKPKEVKFSIRSEEEADRARRTAIHAGVSGLVSGGIFGAYPALTRGTSLSHVAKSMGKWGAISAATVGGGAYIGSRIMGPPRRKEKIPVTKRAAVGGSIIGSTLGLTGGLLAYKTKRGRKQLAEWAKTNRPAHWARRSGVGGAMGVGAAGGALLGGFHAAEEGSYVDTVAALKEKEQKKFSAKGSVINFVASTGVAPDRYKKTIQEKEYERRDSNYFRSAGVGGILGAQFRNRMKMPIGRAMTVGAGAGLAAQAISRNLITKNKKDKFGEATTGAKRIDALPWAAGATAAGMIATGRFYRRSPTFQNLVKKYFSSKSRPIEFAYNERIPLHKMTDAEIEYIGNKRDAERYDKMVYGRRRKTFPAAKRYHTNLKRTAGLAQSLKSQATGTEMVDAKGRVKKKEWEKPYFRTLLGVAAVGGTLLAGRQVVKALQQAPRGSGRRRLAEKLDEGNLHSAAKKVVPGYAKTVGFFRGLRDEAGKLMEKPSGKLADALGAKRKTEVDKLAEKVAAAKAKRAKDIAQGNEPHDYADKSGVINFELDLRDQRGNSARIHWNSKKRERREMEFYERKGFQRAALGVVGVGGPLAGYFVFRKKGANIAKKGANIAIKSERRAASRAASTKYNNPDPAINQMNKEADDLAEAVAAAKRRREAGGAPKPYKDSYGEGGEGVLMSSKSRLIRFAKQEPEKQGMGLGRKIAIGGGLAAAGVGASFLPGAIPMLKIGARHYATSKPGIVRGQDYFGHLVADYLEGANKGLHGGAHGPIVKRFLKSAVDNPEGIAAKIISHKVFNPQKLSPSFAAAHMERFGHGAEKAKSAAEAKAFNHWDWEVGKSWEENARVQGLDPKFTQSSQRKLQNKQTKMHYAREKVHAAIDHHIKEGMNAQQAIRQVATTSSAMLPEVSKTVHKAIPGHGAFGRTAVPVKEVVKEARLVQNNAESRDYFQQLGMHKADAAAGYAKKALVSPGLIAGGTATAGAGLLIGRGNSNSDKRLKQLSATLSNLIEL